VACFYLLRCITKLGTATAFPLRLHFHYKAARAGGVRFKMELAKHFLLTICTIFLFSCANISYHIGSVGSLTAEPTFDPNKTYTYSDDAVSKELQFDDFEVRVIPYNSVTTDSRFELFFIPVEKQGPSMGSVGETPFQISVSVKGKLNKINFFPFKSALNGDVKVQMVKWRDPKPTCNYHYIDWNILALDSFHVVKDRLRNQNEKCMKSGWVEYLLVFNTETPDPKTKFSLELTFQDIDSNKFIKKKLFFNAAKFVSTQTH
jgi:hypothetical protein